MTTLCLTLAKNPAVMETLLGEVDTILAKHDGVVNHETIADMPYLEACIKVSTEIIISVVFNITHPRKTSVSTPQLPEMTGFVSRIGSTRLENSEGLRSRKAPTSNFLIT